MSEYIFTINEKEYRTDVIDMNAEHAVVAVNGQEYRITLKKLGRGKLMPIEVSRNEPRAEAAQRPAAPAAARPAAAPAAAPAAGGDASTVVKSPLPGLVLDVRVREGEAVKAGQVIIVMEAMKMENQIQASCDGTVRKIFIQKGANVAEGDVLAEIGRSAISTL